ncbi:TetR/AcrR family transcriptional regulator [Ornithinibacillus sp. JPR2-1]|uniref:TetR/AcrR family transcriptional regulator n=1 Tax=Ornithinibacillus sp. JPR2-1 TaxID=2094019 RepID=UPI0031DD8353
MQEKEKLILNAAIKLFSIKGFEATSISDICKECGIAKGSFYSYFKSKNDLLLETIEQYFSTIQNRVESVTDLNLQSREQFIMELAYFFEGVFEHKEFFVTLAFEQAIPINDSLKETLYKKQSQTREFYREGLLSVYGDHVTDYLWDLAIMLEGIFQAYIRIFLIDEESLNIHMLAEFILNRMDDIVNGLVSSKDAPILTEKEMIHIADLAGFSLESNNSKIHELLHLLKEEIEKLPNNNNYLISLEVVGEELERDVPREAVIQGMLNNLEGISELEKFVTELKHLLKGIFFQQK